MTMTGFCPRMVAIVLDLGAKARCTRCAGINRQGQPCDPTPVGRVITEFANEEICESCFQYAAYIVAISRANNQGRIALERFSEK